MRIKCQAKLDDKYRIVLDKKTKDKLVKIAQPDNELYIEFETNFIHLAMHSKYWAELNDFCQNIPEHLLGVFYAKLLDDLKINGIITSKMLHEVIKAILGKKSFSFYDMPEHSKRTEFVAKGLELVDRWKEILLED